MGLDGILIIAFMFVLLPIALLVGSRRATSRLFRRLSLISFALWALGLTGLLLVSFDCSGNFLYGFSDCRSFSNTIAKALVPRALLSMAGAIALYAMALLWLGYHAFRRVRGPDSRDYSGPK